MNPENMELFGAIIQRNVDDYAFTSNALIDHWKHRALIAEAELRAIRNIIDNMFDHGQPSERQIFNALYPKDNVIEMFKESE